MSILVISDIHGNIEALEAVLAETQDYDAVICIGDTVGYGANPNECVDRVRLLPNLICLAGNHDLGATGQIDVSLFSSGAARALLWTRERLTSENLDYLRALRPTGSTGPLALAHASPRDPVWEYLEFPDQAAACFPLVAETTCLVGHTHVPRVFEEGTGASASAVAMEVPSDGAAIDLGDGTRRIVNPGSVGQPRDGDPRAAYMIIDLEAGACRFHRLEYPIEETQKKILEAGLPPSLASRLAVGM